MPKILIVDDERYIRSLLEQTLEKLVDEGADLLIAENGEEALQLIKEEVPNIVLLDVMMPKMSGFDVCNTVKNILKISNIYIILLTAKGQEFDKEKGRQVGADLYMTKPFNPAGLLATVREVLGM
jgi:two-component system alkaline phosphatase synthesis response regulator PhoP